MNSLRSLLIAASGRYKLSTYLSLSLSGIVVFTEYNRYKFLSALFSAFYSERPTPQLLSMHFHPKDDPPVPVVGTLSTLRAALLHGFTALDHGDGPDNASDR
ncbi:hypothetical protein BDW22DRAFT_515846 [Trametopsis cervina]|nr:hypothetical protein BDW22DRAFT_515846 [Trametopsis cervina]